MTVTARSQYDERPVFASDLDFSKDKGLTKQADAKDTDINVIMKRFEKTGLLPDMIARDPRYGDFTGVTDLQTSIEIVRKAEDQFLSLDAHIRNRFDNDPVKFAEFVHDPKNEDEMEKLGLLKPEAIERRQKARAEQDKAFLKAEEERLKVIEDAFIAKVVKAVKAS